MSTTARDIRCTTGIIQPMDTALPTIRGPAHTVGAPRSMGRMAEPAWARATTRGPARTRAGLWLTAPTAQPAGRRPITLAQVQLPGRAREPTPMEAGERPQSRGEISGRRARATRAT